MRDGQAIPQVIAWMAAEGERPPEDWTKDEAEIGEIPVEELVSHNFPVTPHPVAENATRVGQPIHVQDSVAENATRVGQAVHLQDAVEEDATTDGQPVEGEEVESEPEETGGEDEFLQATQPEWQILERSDWSPEERARRIYRNRTVAMLRRYLRYSIETGRLPSMLGREFFRSNVTSYRVSTFEDRVIFVFDMEKALDRLDDFSREVLGRVVLQEYDHEEAGRMMGCTRMTVHRRLLEALDLLSYVLREVGLLACVFPNREKACQGGLEGEFPVSDSEQDK